MSDVLPDIVVELARAIGVMDAAGALQPGWFGAPLDALGRMLTTPAQRDALGGALQALAPSEAVAGAAPDERWHPLLRVARGGAFVTWRQDGDALVVGAGARFGGGGTPGAELRAHLPVLRADAVTGHTAAVAGTADGPLVVETRLALGWTAPAQDITLAAVRIAASLAPLGGGSPGSVAVTLEGLDLDGSGARDVRLDASELGAEAAHVLVALLRHRLAGAAGAAAHLMPLLGLGAAGEAIPPLPIAALARDATALPRWVAALLDAGAAPPPIVAWLGHLGALFGGGDPAVADPASAASWRVRLVALGDGDSGLYLTVGRQAAADGSAPLAAIGLALALAPGAHPPARLEGRATIAVLPLGGSGRARALPDAAVLVTVPGAAGDRLSTAIGSLRAGARWDGSRLSPALELDDVSFAGAHYDRVDLSHVDSVEQTAAALVAAAVRDALGSTGAHLAALAGLTAPGGTTGWTHLVDAAQLVTHPTRAIARVHRDALLDGSWPALFAEAAALIGGGATVLGSGTADEPWRAALVTAGPLTIELAAWNEASAGTPALRIALRVVAAAPPFSAAWRFELLAIDLPDGGAARVGLCAGQHGELALRPAPAPRPTAGVAVRADAIAARFDWTPGTPFTATAAIENLSLTAGGATTALGTLRFPGSGAAGLERAARLLVGRAVASWFGAEGAVLAALLGVHGTLGGLPADWPLLGDGAVALLDDPAGALREWLSRVALGVSSDGAAFLPRLLPWLGALLDNALPAAIGDAIDAGVAAGSGSYAAPWRLPIASGALDALVWLEPAGPPAAAAAALQAQFAAATRFDDWLAALQAAAAFWPEARDALVGLRAGDTVAGLDSLRDHLATSDGVVPAASQRPAGWTVGTPLSSAHPSLPHDPAAVAQIHDRIATLGGGAVALVGPAFADAGIWSDVVGGAASARIDFRQPGVDPASIDLSAVAAASFYVIELADDGSNDLASLTAQLSRAVARIVELGASQVTLVAYSTAGVAARALAAAQPARVRGIVALGAPLAGASLDPLTDPVTAAAVRLIARLFPAGLGAAEIGATEIDAALTHLGGALDGYRAAPPGGLPTAARYPLGDFAGSAVSDPPGLPALALVSQLTGDLLEVLKTAAAARLAAAIAPAPTHLGFGVRAHLPLPPAAGAVEVDLSLRADLWHVALVASPPPPRTPALSVVAQLGAASGWLVGEPGATLGGDSPDVRVRVVELGVDLVRADGGVTATPRTRFVDAAYHAPLAPAIELADAAAAALLGAVGRRLDAAPAGSAGAALLDALEAMGLASRSAGGARGFSADGWQALALDPAGFLAPRLRAGIAAITGFTVGADATWSFAPAAAPLAITLSAAPSWSVALTTSGAGLPLGAATLAAAARLGLPGFDGALDATLTAGGTRLTFDHTSGAVTLTAPAWIDPLALRPTPSLATLRAALDQALPRLALSGAATALLEAVLGPDLPVAPLASLLAAPARPFQRAGGGLDPAVLRRLLDGISRALGQPVGGPLALPLGLALDVTGSDTVTVSLATRSPIEGVVGLDLALDIDAHFGVTPRGSIAVTVAAAGGPATLVLGVAPSGVSATVTLPGLAPIALLPTFSGLGALAGAAESLLAGVLDSLVPAAAARSPLCALALEGAALLGVWDETGGFRAHVDRLRALAAADFMTVFPGDRAAVAGWVASLFAAGAPLAAVLPAGSTVTTSGSAVGLRHAFAGSDHGAVRLELGWDAAGPTLGFGLDGLGLGGGVLRLSASAGFVAGQVASALGLAVDLDAAGLALGVSPALVAVAGPGGFTVAVLPLGAGAPLQPTGPLAVTLAPTPAVSAAPDAAMALVRSLLLPLAIDLGLGALPSGLTAPLWSGGPSARDVLQAAGLVDATGARRSLADLQIAPLLARALAVLAGGAPAAPSATARVRFVSDGGRIGVRLAGYQPFGIAGVTARAVFGEPAPFLSDADRGVTLYLFDVSTATPQWKPALHVVGLGLGLAGADDQPLVDRGGFRLGGVDGYLFFDLDLADGLALDVDGAGVQLADLGLPLGGSSPSNPVASGLLRSASTGDRHPVNPPLDLALWRRGGELHAQFDGAAGPVWLGVHAGFGPLYIDQVGIGLVDDAAGGDGIELLVDGGVKVAGLGLELDQLGVTIPLRHVLDADQWRVDLRGLAVDYSASGVHLAGGLLKNPGPPLEYDGVLVVDLGGRGFSVVGSYAQLSDAGGSFTSLFVFASLPLTIGGPPFFYVTGLGAGAGYNRALLPPRDIRAVPRFPLVTAIDDASLANDPMRALAQMGTAMPPRRGSLWMAAGVRFTSYVIVHSVAVVYVQLDRGTQVGLLGTSRMELPTGDHALVNVELGLDARYSTVDQTLSVRAQLTDNSWLLSRDCQLTGGFALFAWFAEGQFVLTLGGYHPAFQKPARFPDVPRLGFHWDHGSGIVLKGEAYFALTNSCVMLGGRLEVSYASGSIRVWFTAAADVLVAWDPFYYDVRIEIEVGASFRMRVCFIRCVTLDFSVSLGARLALSGPPLHGEVTVDLDVASVTVGFGADAVQPDYLHDFETQLAPKYLVGADPDHNWVSVQVAGGLLAPDPPGAQPAPGSIAQPWKLAPEFVLGSETRMPASSFAHFLSGPTPQPAPGAASIDLAPMGPSRVGVGATHKLTLATAGGAAVTPPAGAFSIELVDALVPAATWRFVAPDDVQAAANRLRVLGGFRVVAHAAARGQSAAIPIARLVDDSRRLSQPLPFAAAAAVAGTLVGLGAAAEGLAQLATGKTTAAVTAVARSVLSGPGLFATARGRLGARPAGLDAMGLRALARRSSPPALAAAATGLTLRPVGLSPPPKIVRPPVPAPVALTAPRLRAVLRGRPAPAIDATAVVRTTVAKVATPSDPRRPPPPSPAILGARLIKSAAPAAVQPTQLAHGGRTSIHPELGAAASPAQHRAFAAAAADVIGKGVVLPSGALHVWELPPGAPPQPAALRAARTVILAGSAAGRVSFLDRAGSVVDDRELVPGDRAALAIPAQATMMAVATLGRAPHPPGPGFGSISRACAPPTQIAAVGWQSGSLLAQLGATTLLGRGCCVRLVRAHAALRDGRRTGQAMIVAAEALADQAAVETWLPLGTEVVAVLLDQSDPSAAADGDLALATTGGRLATPPVPVAGGRRRALFYDVASRDPGAAHLAISAASRRGWRLAGVIGLSGWAADWAARFAGGVPAQLVPDEPLSPDGEIVVRLEIGGSA